MISELLGEKELIQSRMLKAGPKDFRKMVSNDKLSKLPV